METTQIGNNNTAQIKAFVEEFAPKAKELKYGKDDNELVVKVYPVVKFVKRSEAVREIVDGVFMDDKDSVRTYAPEFLTILQKYAIIKCFTNFQLPEKLEDLWLVLNYTPIYKDVVQIVGEAQVNEILDAANKAIDTYRQYLVAKTDMHSLMDKIGGLLKNFEEIIPQEDIAEIVSNINGMSKGASIQDIISNLLGNKDVQG